MYDPYSVLGVSRSASDKEIKRAYRNLSRKYHPDSFANSPKAEAEAAAEKFKQIQEAYNQIVSERSMGGRSGGASGGYGYGGYGRGGQSYSEEDQHLMAAMNYIRARRFQEALNVLDGIENRGARWYYFSSVANMGLGNNVVAQEHAQKAVELEPDNMEFQQYYQQLVNGGGYGSFGSPFGGGYGGGFGGYGGYGNYGGGYGGGYDSCGTGNLCCDLWCADSLCECMGGDLCSCI